MSVGRLTEVEQRLLLTAAVAAPSVHNTQPWLFAVRDNRIDLIADTSRQLHGQDSDGRALTISCGAALLNLRVAAEHLGYQPEVQLLPDDGQPDLLARVVFGGQHTHAGMATELFTAIDLRRTNRQPYEDRPVPRSVLDALVEAARQEGAELHTLSDPQDRRRLVELIHEADLDQETNPVRLDEAARWTGVDSDRSDGVPTESLGPLPSTAATPFRDLTLGRSIPGRHFAVFEADPTLAVLTTRHDDRAAWLVTGQALERVLLVATVEGVVSTYANQPLEEPSLRWLVRDPDAPIGFAQMIMRLGYASPAPPTPRRPVDDVIVS